MLHPDESTFLRAIADNYEDHTPRMVFADWLEEHDQTPRAEFIRVQCELAKTTVHASTRKTLETRQRALLDAHRKEWCDTLSVRLEDVSFELGLISKVRLAAWDDGKFLDPEIMPEFSTLTELDLSRLKLDDSAVSLLVAKGNFPSLRKLMLNNNLITETGADALAGATSFPNLTTLFLFENQLSDEAVNLTKRRFLESEQRKTSFKTLDLGETQEGYELSPGQAEMQRRLLVREDLLPWVEKLFTTYKPLQSAVFCVAQYWSDEANDAVHAYLVVSELAEPILEGVSAHEESTTDLNLPTVKIPREYNDSSSALSLYESNVTWDDNGSSIPIWAAYAPDHGSQEYEFLNEVYAPAVLFHRNGTVRFLPMTRPQLDGVRSEWSEELEG